MEAGQEKAQQARRDDGNREMGRLPLALPERSPMAAEKRCGTQRTEETMVVVREEPQSSKMLGAKNSSGGQRCGHRGRASDGLVQSGQAQGSQADFGAPQHRGRGFLFVNTLQGVFFSILPISLAVPDNQPQIK